MLHLLGYTDRLSVAPGQTIQFMVSSDRPEYEARLVRLIHGDENPDGPGFKQNLIPSSIDGRYAGRHQAIRSGSYVEIPLPHGVTGASLAFSVYLMPTNPGAGEQVIASIGDPSGGSGWGLVLTDAGDVELIVGPARISTGSAVHRWTWYRVECTIEDGRAVVRQAPLRPWPDHGSAAEGAGDVALPSLTGPLILGAMRTSDGMTGHLDGKLDEPVLTGLGAWDFAADISSDRVTDRSPGENHGWTVNTPTRAVTGHRFDGSLTDFHLAPEQWSAIHLHRDDLDDARWDVAFSLTIPDDLPSGVYAAWLRSGDDEDHIPFTVRPPRGTARSRIAVLMSTLTYTVYANFTDLGPGAWKEGATNTWTTSAPHADPSLLRDVYRYIDENALYGTYDLHVDGSGVVYGSYLRPILNMRPKFRYRIWAAPPRFPADLYLVDWFDHEGIQVDVITDHDLQAEGASLLEPYAVVVSSSHHEYWSSQMLDGLETYLDAGGRFMLLAGNSLFGVASFDPDPSKPHRVEVRRWGAPWPFEVAPAERVHSTTASPVAPGGTVGDRQTASSPSGRARPGSTRLCHTSGCRIHTIRASGSSSKGSATTS